MRDTVFFKQAELLLRTLPLIHKVEVFALKGMIVNQEGVTVKIEPNLVLRGSVYPPEIKALSKKAQDFFELSVQSRTLAMDELYAGKTWARLIQKIYEDDYLIDPDRSTLSFDPEALDGRLSTGFPLEAYL